MRKFSLLSIVLCVILCTTGCLGDTDEVLQSGTWRLVQLHPSVNVVELNFNNDGTVNFNDLNAGVSGTGTYTTTANIEHRYLEFKGLPDVIGQYPSNYNYKWTIVRCDDQALILAVSIDGLGVIQRDFIKL